MSFAWYCLIRECFNGLTVLVLGFLILFSKVFVDFEVMSYPLSPTILFFLGRMIEFFGDSCGRILVSTVTATRAISSPSPSRISYLRSRIDIQPQKVLNFLQTINDLTKSLDVQGRYISFCFLYEKMPPQHRRCFEENEAFC